MFGKEKETGGLPFSASVICSSVSNLTPLYTSKE